METGDCGAANVRYVRVMLPEYEQVAELGTYPSPSGNSQVTGPVYGKSVVYERSAIGSHFELPMVELVVEELGAETGDGKHTAGKN